MFSGLITFLFVASGDTPKVPYQTRLDLFMMFSFVIVAVIMFIHGALYYFREQGFQGEKEKKLQKLENTKMKHFIKNMSKAKSTSDTKGSTTRRTSLVVGAKSATNLGTGAGTERGGAYAVSSPNGNNGDVELMSPSGGHDVASPVVPSGSSMGGGNNTPPIKNAFGEDGGGGSSSERARSSARGESKVTVTIHSTPSPSPAVGSGGSGAQPSARGSARGNNGSASQRGRSDGVTESSLSGAGAVHAGSELHDGSEDEEDSRLHGWEVRLNDWREWTCVAWFAALACTRKWDVIIVVTQQHIQQTQHNSKLDVIMLTDQYVAL